MAKEQNIKYEEAPVQEKHSLWPSIAVMMFVGFVGLLGCGILEKITGGGADPDLSSPLQILTIIFVIIWMMALIVLLPVQVLYFDRKERQGKPPEKMTFSDVIGLPFGASNPNAELPGWIAAPVKICVWMIAGYFIFFMILVLIGLVSTFLFAAET